MLPSWGKATRAPSLFPGAETGAASRPLAHARRPADQAVEDERSHQDRRYADRSSRHRVSEVVLAQADKRGRHGSRQRDAGGGQEDTRHDRHRRMQRADQQDDENGDEGSYARGMSAGEAQRAEESPVDEWFEQEFGRSGGARHSHGRQQCPADPPRPEAGQHHNRRHHGHWDGTTEPRQYLEGARMATKAGLDQVVDRRVQASGPDLMREEDSEERYEPRTDGNQDARRRTERRGQQRAAACRKPEQISLLTPVSGHEHLVILVRVDPTSTRELRR